MDAYARCAVSVALSGVLRLSPAAAAGSLLELLHTSAPLLPLSPLLLPGCSQLCLPVLELNLRQSLTLLDMVGPERATLCRRAPSAYADIITLTSSAFSRSSTSACSNQGAAAHPPRRHPCWVSMHRCAVVMCRISNSGPTCKLLVWHLQLRTIFPGYTLLTSFQSSAGQQQDERIAAAKCFDFAPFLIGLRS